MSSEAAHPNTSAGQSTYLVPPGTLLAGRFLVIRVIAKTALSTVYFGRDRRTSRPVAIKQLGQASQSQILPYATALRLFIREAHLLHDLRHLQLPQLQGFIREQSGWFLIMDYIDGLTLEQFLDRQELSLDFVLAIAEQICNVLSYLHGQTPPIIHADIKPSNIVLALDGHVKLIDLGIACGRNQAKLAIDPMGTPPYTPPEQWRGEPLDQRSDVYALGMVLREILSSRNGRSRVYRVLARATEPMPDDRYATVEQLRWALQRAKSQWNQPGLGDDVLTRQLCAALIVFILVVAFLLP